MARLTYPCAVLLLYNLVQAVPTLQQRQSDECGTGVFYDPSQYTCYDNDQLCPILNGIATKSCGSDCYSEFAYSCTADDSLNLLPFTTTRFTLTAYNPNAPFNGETIEASASHFFIGAGPTAYCPVGGALTNATCALWPGTNTTMDTAALADIVPGGQSIFWQTTGAMAFTTAHSDFRPDQAFEDDDPSIAYSGGGFFGPHGEQLTACPVREGVWQVFARLDLPTSMVGDGCVDFVAVVREAAYRYTVSAWEYI